MNNRIICFIAMCYCLTFNNVMAASAKKVNYNYNYANLKKTCRVYDPYESVNRPIFMFNGVLDTFTLRPLAKIYGRFTSNYIKARISSFSYNIGEPLSAVNYGIQGKPKGFFTNVWRFVVNSTVGVAGLFDVASILGVTGKRQTFGNTLAHYGVGPGPYVVLPIYGGMGMRDVMDALALNNYMNPIKYAVHIDFKVSLLTALNARDEMMPFTDHISRTSPDPYITIRNALMNRREAQMQYPQSFKCPVVKDKI